MAQILANSLRLFINTRLCVNLDRSKQAIYSSRRRRPSSFTVDMRPTPEPCNTIFNAEVRGNTPCTQVSLDFVFSLPKTLVSFTRQIQRMNQNTSVNVMKLRSSNHTKDKQLLIRKPTTRCTNFSNLFFE